MKLSLNTNFTAFKMSAMVALLSLASVEPVVLGAQQAAHAVAPASKVQTPAVAGEEEESAARPKKPGEEGIKVHGDWVLDVHNADGSLAEHRVFRNSLAADQGQNVLLYLLSGQLTPASMAIGAFASVNFFGNTVTNSGYYLTAPNANVADLCTRNYACIASETTTVTPAFVTASTTPLGQNVLTPGKIVLQGQVAPGQPITINYVQTLLIGCHQTSYTGPALVSPSACTAVVGGTPTSGKTDFQTFTATGIPDVNVAAGQYVVINVTISFS